MAVELGPSDLPKSLAEAFDAQMVPLMSSVDAGLLVDDYRKAIHAQKRTSISKPYNMSIQFSRKKWYLEIEGPLKHIRHNKKSRNHEICKYDYNSLTQYDACANLDRFSYMTASGPIDEYSTAVAQLGKLLLLLNNSRFSILKNNDQNLFQSQGVVYSKTDNF